MPYPAFARQLQQEEASRRCHRAGLRQSGEAEKGRVPDRDGAAENIRLEQRVVVDDLPQFGAKPPGGSAGADLDLLVRDESVGPRAGRCGGSGGQRRRC